MSAAPHEAEVAYTISEAAAIKRVSPDVIRRAIKATEGPHIKAKMIGRGYRIPAGELDRWFASLDDA